MFAENGKQGLFGSASYQVILALIHTGLDVALLLAYLQELAQHFRRKLDTPTWREKLSSTLTISIDTVMEVLLSCKGLSHTAHFRPAACSSSGVFGSGM